MNIRWHTAHVLSAKRDVLLPDRDVLQPAVPLWKVIVGAHADEKLSPSLRARRFSYMLLTIFCALMLTPRAARSPDLDKGWPRNPRSH